MRLINADTALPEEARRSFEALRPALAANPEFALEHIDILARETARRLDRLPPESDLARCVGLEAFLRFHATDAVRRSFPNPAAFTSYVLNAPDPSSALDAALSASEPLFPAEHSWLVEAPAIDGLDGMQLRQLLRIRPNPPYVAFVLGLAEMIELGVSVRPARAVDAIPERLYEWSPEGLPGGQREFLDGNVPRAALSTVGLRL
jgi:hypothetical protein